MDGNTGSRELRKQRMAICRSCDSFRKDVPLCKECGCFMPIKTSLKNSFCPLGKWAEAK
jgi:hypothetical protein